MTADDKPASAESSTPTPAPTPATTPEKTPATGFSAPAAWRIDGIDVRVQSRAAQAAAESNLPLAEWLAKAIDAAAAPASRGGRGDRVIAFGAGALMSAALAVALIWASGPLPSQRPSVASAPPEAAAPPPVAAANPGPTAATAAPPAAPTATPVAEAPAAQAQTPAAPAPAVAPAPAGPRIDPNDPLADLKRAAHAGDAAAQFALAARHASGDGVDQDWGEAFKWFKLAAEQGMATAQHNLAVMYVQGHGTERDPEQATRWYALAAEQGYPPSQFNLAVAYARGWGVEADMRKAVTWFERAAERIPQANVALAELFEAGVGMGRDLLRARAHYQLAAVAGDQRAADKLRQLTPEFVERETLKEIQTLLARLRYNVGTPDGRMGQRTAAAIREFQRSAGLAQDGKATSELLETLRGVAPAR